MAVTVEGLVARLPAFAEADEVALQLAIDEATRRVNRDYFGAVADDATLYLAAHLASSGSAGNASAGPVQSVSVGSVSVTYGSSGADLGSLANTPYGVLYNDLLQSRQPGILVV